MVHFQAMFTLHCLSIIDLREYFKKRKSIFSMTFFELVQHQLSSRAYPDLS